ncbi:hypothetical protein QA811_02025 [Streptomyces sp. B21-102]|uniref:hypothetical protein n=1 Tax=Streptomyces sp. B21-102 TaxID=3039416 RepID=UPI002FEF9043
MRRIAIWLALVVYLAIVGWWPAAVAPVALIGAGFGVIFAVAPGPVLIAAVAWWKHQASRTATA